MDVNDEIKIALIIILLIIKFQLKLLVLINVEDGFPANFPLYRSKLTCFVQLFVNKLDYGVGLI